MSSVEIERERFWNIYQEVLDENGTPFSITPTKQWAVVNTGTSNWNRPMISMDFSVKKCILRINAFILDDIQLYNNLLENKIEIEKILGFAPVWAHGEKGKNTYRIKVELPLIPYDRDDYHRVSVQSLPVVQKYIEAFKSFIRC